MLQGPCILIFRSKTHRIDELEKLLSNIILVVGKNQDPACFRPFQCGLWELRSPRQFMRLQQIAHRFCSIW